MQFIKAAQLSQYSSKTMTCRGYKVLLIQNMSHADADGFDKYRVWEREQHDVHTRLFQ